MIWHQLDRKESTMSNENMQNNEDECCYTGTCSCRPSCTCGCQSGKAEEFLALAETAHHELLKQKMKAAFEAKIGKKMDRVAELVVDTALVYMQDNMGERRTMEKFEDKLMDIFKG